MCKSEAFFSITVSRSFCSSTISFPLLFLRIIDLP
jgi:hypothetical protein